MLLTGLPCSRSSHSGSKHGMLHVVLDGSIKRHAPRTKHFHARRNPAPVI
jgi:hypothetical protein